MKKLLAVLSVLLITACSGAKVTDQFTLADGNVKVKVFDAPCQVEAVKDAARAMGAPEADVAKFKSAQITINGKEVRKGCVHYFSPDAVFIGDETGASGIVPVERAGK